MCSVGLIPRKCVYQWFPNCASCYLGHCKARCIVGYLLAGREIARHLIKQWLKASSGWVVCKTQFLLTVKSLLTRTETVFWASELGNNWQWRHHQSLLGATCCICKTGSRGVMDPNSLRTTGVQDYSFNQYTITYLLPRVCPRFTWPLMNIP